MKDFCWRLSFSQYESMLHNCGSLRDGKQYCIKLVLRLLKKLKPQLKPLNSYHLKTICFWLQEEKGPAPHQWSDDQRGYLYHHWCYDQCKERLKDALSLLESYLKYQYCPHYFIRNVNLFKKFSHQTCAELALIVSNLKMNPETNRYLAKDVVPVEGEGWGVTADMYPPSQIRTPGSYPQADLGPPGPNPLADMYPPFANLDPRFISASGFGAPRPNSASGYVPPFANLDPRYRIWTPTPRVQICQRIWTPFADLRPLPDFPFKHPLYHIW